MRNLYHSIALVEKDVEKIFQLASGEAMFKNLVVQVSRGCRGVYDHCVVHIHVAVIVQA